MPEQLGITSPEAEKTTRDKLRDVVDAGVSLLKFGTSMLTRDGRYEHALKMQEDIKEEVVAYVKDNPDIRPFELGKDKLFFFGYSQPSITPKGENAFDDWFIQLVEGSYENVKVGYRRRPEDDKGPERVYVYLTPEMKDREIRRFISHLETAAESKSKGVSNII